MFDTMTIPYNAPNPRDPRYTALRHALVVFGNRGKSADDADLFWLFFKNPRLSASSAEKLGQLVGLTKIPLYGKVECTS